MGDVRPKDAATFIRLRRQLDRVRDDALARGDALMVRRVDEQLKHPLFSCATVRDAVTRDAAVRSPAVETPMPIDYVRGKAVKP